MKALLITRDTQLCAEIASQGAARVPPLDAAATRTTLRDAIDRVPNGGIGCVIIDASSADVTEADMFERLCKQYSQASLMLLMREQQPELLIRAMRAGVRDVLQLPLEHRAFHEAIDRLSAVAGDAVAHDGKVLAFVSCKGGSGATFISTNFGYALSSLAEKKVLLIDLNGQFGDAILYVSDQKPAMTLSDVCGQIARIDGAFLASCTVKVGPRLSVLAAAEDPAVITTMKPEQMDTVLRVARQHYDYVVLDMGRQIDAASLRALDNADAIYPVLQLALPDIRDGRRLLEIFRSLGYPADHVRLIVNRYEKGGRLGLEDLQSALGVRVLHTVPNDYVAVTDSVNQGVPVLQLSGASAVARSLGELVEAVAGRSVPATRSRLFSRWFGRAPA